MSVATLDSLIPASSSSFTNRCASPASLMLFDVSTLYFETDAGDGFP